MALSQSMASLTTARNPLWANNIVFLRQGAVQYSISITWISLLQTPGRNRINPALLLATHINHSNPPPMDPYHETFDTWNNIASIYQDKFMGMDLYNETYDFICTTILKPGASLLEIGCGPGNITKYLLAHRPDFEIFGIDIAPNMVDLARKNNPTATFAVMHTRHITQLDRNYDGIIAGFCLPYLSPTESNDLISNASELLHGNGLLYLSFVEGNPEDSGFKTGSGGRVYFHYHNLQDLKKQLIKSQFDRLKTFKVKYKTSETEFDTHTILTAIKNPL